MIHVSVILRNPGHVNIIWMRDNSFDLGIRLKIVRYTYYIILYNTIYYFKFPNETFGGVSTITSIYTFTIHFDFDNLGLNANGYSLNILMYSTHRLNCLFNVNGNNRIIENILDGIVGSDQDPRSPKSVCHRWYALTITCIYVCYITIQLYNKLSNMLLSHCTQNGRFYYIFCSVSKKKSPE